MFFLKTPLDFSFWPFSGLLVHIVDYCVGLLLAIGDIII